MTAIQIDRTIDARGMACPGPLMNLIGAIRGGQVGAAQQVLALGEGPVQQDLLAHRPAGTAALNTNGGSEMSITIALRKKQGAITLFI